MLPEIYTLFWQHELSSGLVTRPAINSCVGSSDDFYRIRRHFSGRRRRTESGDDPELETTPGRRNCACRHRRVRLGRGGYVPSGRFGVVVGRRGRRWNHRRTDRLDERRTDTITWPLSASPRLWTPSTMVRSSSIITTGDGIKPPVAASARLARLAGTPGPLVRAFLTGITIASGTARRFSYGPGPPHPQGHQHRQAHNQRAHQQPQHVQAQRQQHRHGHGHHTHQQTRHAHPQVHRHGHAHRW